MKLLDVLNEPWAIVPAKLHEIREIYLTHLRGEKIDIREIEERLGKPLANEQKPYHVEDGVAVLSIEGVMAKRMNLFSRISGGISTQLVERDFSAALADPFVHSIVLLIDSPGGEVDGALELSQRIFNARGEKPIVALGESMMASAAYWVGSAADKVYISGETTQVGSIGVVATHTDYSVAEEKRGIRVTEITAGRYKRIASEHMPLSAEGRADIQERVDHVYSAFVESVAAHRGVTAEKVAKDMAEGRIFLGRKALEAGLVDGFVNLGALIERLSEESRTAAITGAVSSELSEGELMATEKTPTQTAAPKTLTEQELAEKINASRAEGHEQGRNEGFTAGKAEGLTEGATMERDRIKAVEAQFMPGHEKLIEQLKFDGKTSGPEAAAAIIAAEKQTSTARLAGMREDSPEPAPATSAAPKPPKKEIDAQKVAEKAREFQREERAKGREISVTDAVAHVMEQGQASATA